jgi:hypothetical protein
MDAEILVKMREREGREMGVLKAKVEEIKKRIEQIERHFGKIRRVEFLA